MKFFLGVTGKMRAALTSVILAFLAVASADHSDEPGSIDNGTIIGGVLGIVAGGLCCGLLGRYIAGRIKENEADKHVQERNSRRQKMGRVELEREKKKAAKTDTKETPSGEDELGV